LEALSQQLIEAQRRLVDEQQAHEHQREEWTAKQAALENEKTKLQEDISELQNANEELENSLGDALTKGRS